MRRASGTSASFRTVEPLLRKLSTRLTVLLLMLLLFTGALMATAQDGLYGPEAPRDVSYLRVINARPGEPVTPTVDGEQWGPLEFAQVSPYRQLAPGDYHLAVGGMELNLSIGPESFTTVALLEDEIIAINDTPLRDISRGLLTLYNLTSEATLSLATADGTSVVTGVAPRSSASRTISEAQVELVVSSDGESLGTLDSRLYRRGEAHSIIVLPVGSDPRVIYVRAAAEL